MNIEKEIENILNGGYDENGQIALLTNLVEKRNNFKEKEEVIRSNIHANLSENNDYHSMNLSVDEIGDITDELTELVRQIIEEN